MERYLGVEVATFGGACGYDLNDIGQFEIVANKIRLEIINKLIKSGVIFLSTSNIFVDDTVEIGKGTILHSDNHLRGKTKIGKNCVIESGNIIDDAVVGSGAIVIKSVLKNCAIGAKTTVGPFANIHSGSVIAKECRVDSCNLHCNILAVNFKLRFCENFIGSFKLYQNAVCSTGV
ncbi:MAG: hypothetical protein RSB59_01595, partial [Clostridia bacterium]